MIKLDFNQRYNFSSNAKTFLWNVAQSIMSSLCSKYYFIINNNGRMKQKRLFSYQFKIHKPQWKKPKCPHFLRLVLFQVAPDKLELVKPLCIYSADIRSLTLDFKKKSWGKEKSTAYSRNQQLTALLTNSIANSLGLTLKKTSSSSLWAASL